jgi:hypothetical protein
MTPIGRNVTGPYVVSPTHINHYLQPNVPWWNPRRIDPDLCSAWPPMVHVSTLSHAPCWAKCMWPTRQAAGCGNYSWQNPGRGHAHVSRNACIWSRFGTGNARQQSAMVIVSLQPALAWAWHNVDVNITRTVGLCAVVPPFSCGTKKWSEYSATECSILSLA